MGVDCADLGGVHRHGQGIVTLLGRVQRSCCEMRLRPGNSVELRFEGRVPMMSSQPKIFNPPKHRRGESAWHWGAAASPTAGHAGGAGVALRFAQLRTRRGHASPLSGRDFGRTAVPSA